MAQDMANRILEVVKDTKPDVIVIEETSKGRSGMTQKAIEFLHAELNRQLFEFYKTYLDTNSYPVNYVRNSHWRQNLGLALSKEQRKQNSKLTQLKKLQNLNEEKKKLGIKGRITKKHLSVNNVNQIFGLNFKQKDNDIADAINLRISFY